MIPIKSAGIGSKCPVRRNPLPHILHSSDGMLYPNRDTKIFSLGVSTGQKVFDPLLGCVGTTILYQYEVESGAFSEERYRLNLFKYPREDFLRAEATRLRKR